MLTEVKYRTVKIEKGSGGWGGPLIVAPDRKKNKIVSITGGGIHPLAKKIAELTGAEVVDGFNNPVPNEVIACAVVDCGGTLRTGLFPKQGIPTVNVLPGGPSGPLADYCTPELYVSGTKIENISLVEGSAVRKTVNTTTGGTKTEKQDTPQKVKSYEVKSNVKFLDRSMHIMEVIGKFIGMIVNVFYQAARDTVNMMIKNVLPFMIFLALMAGIITKTGFGNLIANILQPFTGSVIGLIIFALIIGIPVISPLLGPGAVIQSVLGVFIGTSISNGIVSPAMALPALFAISIVDACDFIPVAASLGEAKTETARVAVPAMLFSRFITAPIAVLIGYLFSIGLY